MSYLGNLYGEKSFSSPDSSDFNMAEVAHLPDLRIVLFPRLLKNSKPVDYVREVARTLFRKYLLECANSLPDPSAVWIRAKYKTPEEFAEKKLKQLEEDKFLRKVGEIYELGEKGKLFL